MRETIEIIAQIDIEYHNIQDRQEIIAAAVARAMRISETTRDWRIEARAVHQMSREQSRAVRAATGAAKNGGAVPRTMDEVGA